MSPSNFSLIAETTSCHKERIGGIRDSSEAGREAEEAESEGISRESSWSENLREGPWRP